MDPRDFLEQLMKARGLNPNSLAAATSNKTKQPQIYRFLKGLAKEPKRSTFEPVAHFFRVPVEAFFDAKAADKAWAEYLAGQTAWTPQQPAPAGLDMHSVAHDLSQPNSDHEPITCSWEFILSAVPLPPRFRMAAPDDAMAPLTPKGTVLIFSTDAEPAFGHGVLVEDATGMRYLRRYAQGPGGRWIAEARNSAYLALDSASGLRVLAVVIGRETGEI